MYEGKLSPAVKTSLKILVCLGLMDIVYSKTVFRQLIPDLSCSKAGEHGCLCYQNVDCNATKYLECIDGKCHCEFPFRRTFDKNLGKCVSLVGSFCGAWIPECIRNSECDGGRCLCRAGYSKSMNNSCMINFGEECGPNHCNVDRGLACKQGLCQCLDSSYVYSAIHTNCIDPEAVVRNVIRQITQRIVQALFNFKLTRIMNKVTRPFRFITRLALGGVG